MTARQAQPIVYHSHFTDSVVVRSAMRPERIMITSAPMSATMSAHEKAAHGLGGTHRGIWICANLAFHL